MKTLLTLAAFILGSFFSIQAQNLINNGDFENWRQSGSNPASWKIATNKANPFFEQGKDKQQGNYLRLMETNPEGSKAKSIENGTDINIASAGTYELSFKVKGKVGLRYAALTIKGERPGSKDQTPTNHFVSFGNKYRSVTEFADWTEVKTTIVVPATATFSSEYRLFISWSDHRLTAPACDFFMDDVKLVKIN